MVVLVGSLCVLCVAAVFGIIRWTKYAPPRLASERVAVVTDSPSIELVGPREEPARPATKPEKEDKLDPSRVRAQVAEGGIRAYQTGLKSAVWVITGSHSDEFVTGSGSLIDRDRHLVLTNYHVVGSNDRAVVLFPAYLDGKLVAERDYYLQHGKDLGISGRVVALDKQADLAIIQIDRVPDIAQPLPIAASGVSPGQTVHSLGNPGRSGALWVYTAGKVRQVYQKKWEASAGQDALSFQAKVIESDSPTNPGDSGGPLVNDSGELVGVTQGGANNASLLSTFIDASEVRRFLDTRTVQQINAGAKPESAVQFDWPDPSKPPSAMLKLFEKAVASRNASLLAISADMTALAGKVEKERQSAVSKGSAILRDNYLQRMVSDIHDVKRKLDVLGYLTDDDITKDVAFPLRFAKVVQVLGQTSALVNSGLSDSQLMMLRGVSMARVTDGSYIPLQGTYWATGTETYRTVIGGTNTVMVVEPIDLKPLEQLKTKHNEEWQAKVREVDSLGKKAKEEIGRLRESIAPTVAAEKRRDAEKAAAAAAEAKEKAAAADAEAKKQKAETAAAAKLTFAKQFLLEGDIIKAHERLESIVKDYPGTKAAAEAAKLLK